MKFNRETFKEEITEKRARYVFKFNDEYGASVVTYKVSEKYIEGYWTAWEIMPIFFNGEETLPSYDFIEYGYNDPKSFLREEDVEEQLIILDRIVNVVGVERQQDNSIIARITIYKYDETKGIAWVDKEIAETFSALMEDENIYLSFNSYKSFDDKEKNMAMIFDKKNIKDINIEFYNIKELKEERDEKNGTK